MGDQPQPQQQEMNANAAADRVLDLPPGFRFHPSDVEIVTYYLSSKVRDRDFTCTAIGEVDLNKTEPWDLPNMAKWGEKEFYFFYQKDRKYPTGLRANRATEAGYWKATGKDKEVYHTPEGEGAVLLVGMKKTLVFYKGRAPRGDKTNWVMHEYRLEGSGRIPNPASTSSSSAANVTAMKASTSASKDEWVVCRVFHKTNGIKKEVAPTYQLAMAGAEIDQNQNNIPAIPIPILMPLPLPLPNMQFPIIADFAIEPLPPFYPNADDAHIMPPMEGFGGVGGLQINGAMFGNPMALPPPINFYHHMGMAAAVAQMGMGGEAHGQIQMGGIGVAAGQMGMGAPGVAGFDVAASESQPSSMVSQRDEHANAAEISSMMSVAGPGSGNTTIEMDGMSKY